MNYSTFFGKRKAVSGGMRHFIFRCLWRWNALRVRRSVNSPLRFYFPAFQTRMRKNANFRCGNQSKKDAWKGLVATETASVWLYRTNYDRTDVQLPVSFQFFSASVPVCFHFFSGFVPLFFRFASRKFPLFFPCFSSFCVL